MRHGQWTGDRPASQGRRADGAPGRPAAGVRRAQRARARQAARRQARRGRDDRDPAAHRRAAVPHPGRAQGRRDEVRPGAVGARGGAARRGRRALPRPADPAPGLRAADADPDRARQPRARPRARTGASSWSGSTAARPPPRRSARCTGAAGTTAARSRSRCSTPAPATRCAPTCASSPGWPAPIGPLVPGRRHQAADRGAAGPRRRRARLPPRGRGAARLRRGLPRRPRHRGARRGRGRRARCWSPSGWRARPSLAAIIADGTQEERDHYGELFVRFLFAGPARTGMLHADPHPGNFRILPDADGAPGPARRARLRRRGPAARRRPARGDGPR